MKKDDIYYGLDGQERLVESVEEVIHEVLDTAVTHVGESFAETAAGFQFPILVFEFKRMDIGDAKTIGESALNYILERLDEEYSNPDGDYTNPTEAMKEAALAFGESVVGGYVPWMCEQTGTVIKVSRQSAEGMI
jgi:hypothetical protein